MEALIWNASSDTCDSWLPEVNIETECHCTIFRDLKSLSDNNFQIKGPQDPELLLYEQGYFFTRHRDRGKGGYDGYDERGVGERRVSVVTLVASENLTGGELVLYGLRGARLLGLFGMEMRMPVEFAPDLMVAFRADTEHEVKPVITGERISAVTWFV